MLTRAAANFRHGVACDAGSGTPRRAPSDIRCEVIQIKFSTHFTDTAHIGFAKKILEAFMRARFKRMVSLHGTALAKTLIRICMFARIFTISVIFLLLSRAYVMAAVIRSSSNSTSCGDGDTRCCEEVRKIQDC